MTRQSVALRAVLGVVGLLFCRAGASGQVVVGLVPERLAGVDLGADDLLSSAFELFDMLCSTSGDRPAGVLYLHTAEASYLEADQKVGGGRFAKNLAFSARDPAECHVVLQPASGASLGGLPIQTRRLMAHEAAHLARYARFPNSPSYPAWLANGVAQAVSARAVGVEVLSVATSIDDPWLSTQVVQLQSAVREGRWPGLAAVLAGEDGGLRWAEVYAAGHAVVEFLIASDVFEAVIKEARRLGGGSQYRQRLAEFVLSTLAPGGDPEAAFLSFLAAKRPLWDEVFRSLDTSAGGDAGPTWHQAAFDSNALAWRLGDDPGERWTIGGTVTVSDAGKRQMNLLLCGVQAGFLSVAIGPDFGATIFRYRSEDGSWTRLAGGSVAGLAVGHPVEFAATSDGQRLELRVGDASFGVDLLDGESGGRWGVGAQSGSAGAWHGVRREVSARP